MATLFEVVDIIKMKILVSEKSALGERSSARRESVRRRVVRQGGASRRSPVSSGV